MTTMAQTSHQAGRRARRPTAPRAAAFWTVAVLTALLLAASSAPSPLYPVLQKQFGFSSLTLTAVFAVYVLALLAALLVVGRVSDVLGRRPVLAAALAVETAAMALFLAADSTGWLILARIVQGVATGAALGVLGAYLLDLQPGGGSRLGSLVNSAAPSAGLGLGSFGTGVLVQYAPYPTHLVFALLTGAFVMAVVLVVFLPETVGRVSGLAAALRPTVAVPARARRAFAAAAPTLIVTWALAGLVLGLGGSIVGGVFAHPNDAVVGLVIGSLAATAAVTTVLVRDLDVGAAARWGMVGVLAGVVFVLVGLATLTFAVFVIGSVVAGAGFGAAFLGSLRAVTQLAEPHERAGLLSAVYVVSYLAFSVPTLVAGLLISHLGLRPTVTGYAVFELAVALVGLVLTRRT